MGKLYKGILKNKSNDWRSLQQKIIFLPKERALKKADISINSG